MARTIKHIIGENGLFQTDQEEIMRIFTDFLLQNTNKYRLT